MNQAENTLYTIRAFLGNEADIYKAMRLEALQLEPGMFGNSYAYEAGLDDDYWVNRITADHCAVFGLFYEKELIGITGIIKDKEKHEEAYMTQSYIRNAYRGKGLSHMLYDIRLEWARSFGIKRLVIGHRQSNMVSKSANQHYGFKYTHKESRTWPDGVTEDMCYYELML